VSTAVDISRLEISVSPAGFRLGVSRLGEKLGSVSELRIDVRSQLLDITIGSARELEDDILPGPGARTVTVRARFSDSPRIFRGMVLRVAYRGLELCAARLDQVNRSATADPDQPGGVLWEVTMSTADNAAAAGTLLNLAPFNVSGMLEGLSERLPDVTDISVSPEILHRARTVQLPVGYAWGGERVPKDQFLRDVARVLGCSVEIPAEDSRTLYLRALTDGPAWELFDQSSPSYISAQWADDRSHPTGIRGTALGTQTDEINPDLYSAERRASGVVRRDKDLQLATIPDSRAVETVLSWLPVLGEGREELESVYLPMTEELIEQAGTLADPALVTIWLKRERWQALCIGVEHRITPDSWAVTLSCGPRWLADGSGAAAPPVSGLEAAGGVLSWDPPMDASAIRVDWRTDRWAQWHGEGAGGADLAGDASSAVLPAVPGVYRVSVWAAQGSAWSEPRTLETEVV